MKLRLTATAVRQLERILAYIDARNPRGALHVQRRILEIMNLLAFHPFVGPATSRKPRRRIVASPYPYSITYRVGDEEVVILGIRHTSRRPD